jgi:hypothetical protein
MTKTPRSPALALALCCLLAAAVLSAQNPLARKPAADPFARTFVGDEVQLALQRDGAGYSGSLTVAGATFPVRAARVDEGLQGTFTADGEDYEFVCTLDGDALTLQSGGERYNLRAKAPAPAAKSNNPLARRDAPNAAGGKDGPQELEGAYQGAVDTLRHPDGARPARRSEPTGRRRPTCLGTGAQGRAR